MAVDMNGTGGRAWPRPRCRLSFGEVERVELQDGRVILFLPLTCERHGAKWRELLNPEVLTCEERGDAMHVESGPDEVVQTGEVVDESDEGEETCFDVDEGS